MQAGELQSQSSIGIFCSCCKRPLDAAASASLNSKGNTNSSASSESSLDNDIALSSAGGGDVGSGFDEDEPLRLIVARFLVQQKNVPLCRRWPHTDFAADTNSLRPESSSSLVCEGDNSVDVTTSTDQVAARTTASTRAESAATKLDSQNLRCAASRVLCCVITGSAGYGLANTDGTSDVDLRAVYIADTRALLAASADLSSQELTLGFPSSVATVPPNSRVQYEDACDTLSQEIDFVVHELRDELLLLASGNPFQLELLFSPDLTALGSASSSNADSIWLALVRERRKFLTRQLVREQLSYADGQLRFQAKMRDRHRPVPAKRLYHVPRILLEALRVLRGNEPAIRICDESELLDLRRVKSGAMSDETFVNWCDSLRVSVVDLMSESSLESCWRILPEFVDLHWLNKWLVDVRKQNLRNIA